MLKIIFSLLIRGGASLLLGFKSHFRINLIDRSGQYGGNKSDLKLVFLNYIYNSKSNKFTKFER